MHRAVEEELRLLEVGLPPLHFLFVHSYFLFQLDVNLHRLDRLKVQKWVDETN